MDIKLEENVDEFLYKDWKEQYDQAAQLYKRAVENAKNADEDLWELAVKLAYIERERLGVITEMFKIVSKKLTNKKSL